MFSWQSRSHQSRTYSESSTSTTNFDLASASAVELQNLRTYATTQSYSSAVTNQTGRQSASCHNGTRQSGSSLPEALAKPAQRTFILPGRYPLHVRILLPIKAAIGFASAFVPRSPDCFSTTMNFHPPIGLPDFDSLLWEQAKLTDGTLQAPRGKYMIYPFYVLFGTTMAGEEAPWLN